MCMHINCRSLCCLDKPDILDAASACPSMHTRNGSYEHLNPCKGRLLHAIAALATHQTMCCKHAAAMQGALETAKLHFVELAAPPSKQARGGEGPKGGLAQAQALSKAYSSLTSVLLALKQQRRKQDQEAPRSDHSTHISASSNFNAAKLAMIPFCLHLCGENVI